MAIVFENTLKSQITKDRILPVYILLGEDGYLKRFYSEKISKFTAEEDDIFNYCKFESTCDLQEVYDFALQLPMMAEKKYCELYDYDFENCSKPDFDRLCELVSEVPETSVLVLRFDSVEFDIKKSSRLKKLISCAEKNDGIACNLCHRQTPELIKMLVNGALKRNCKIEASTARYMIENCGTDINTLQRELEKLCSFCKEAPITKEHIDEVCIKTVEASVFLLSDFIFACNAEKALTLLDKLLFTRIEPISIFYNICSPFSDIYRMLAANESGKNASSVLELYGRNYSNKAFLLEKASNNLKKIDLKKLNLCFDALLDADKKLKSFNSEQRTVLEQLIVRLVYIIAKGETVD